MHSSAVPKRNQSLSDRPQPQQIFTAGMKKPAQSAQDVGKSTFYYECPTSDKKEIKQSGRSPYLHIHSPGAVCPACAALEAEAMEDSFADLPFSSAFTSWIDRHKPFIQPRTLHDYYQYGSALMDFFEESKLKDVGIGAIRGFQMWRSHIYAANDTMELPLDSRLMTSKYRHSAGNVRIKNEINCVLKPMLREAGQWAAIEEKKFKHLPVPREGSGVPLDRSQQAEFLAVAFSKKKWLLAAHCLRIEYRTGTGFGELRKVRRKHVDLKAATVQIIEGAKNSGVRVRPVPLIPSALESMKWIIDRFVEKGGGDPEEYILFHRTKGLSVPMGSIHRAFIAIRAEWVKRHPNTARVETRQCDARTSTACLLLKNPALSLPTIHKTLGWMPSSRMRDRYNRVDHNAKMEVLRTLEDGYEEK